MSFEVLFESSSSAKTAEELSDATIWPYLNQKWVLYQTVLERKTEDM